MIALRAFWQGPRQALNFHGATGRQAYALYAGAWLLVVLAITLFKLLLPLGIWGQATLVAVSGVVGFPMMALISRRLHDAGQSGIWALLFPIAGVALAVLVFLLPTREPARSRPRALLRHKVAGLVVIILAAFSVSRLFWAPVEVTGSNMVPTLIRGDYLVVTRGAPKPGDVVVYEIGNGTGPATPFVNRTIALAGEGAGLLDGALILNGASVDQFTLGAFEDPDAIWEKGGLCSAAVDCTLIEEILPNGQRYMTLDAGTFAQLDTTVPRRVPEDHIYVLGDHRDNSIDSRLARDVGGHGTIPLEEVVGIVRRIAFSAPFGNWISVRNWRNGRYWKHVSHETQR